MAKRVGIKVNIAVRINLKIRDRFRTADSTQIRSNLLRGRTVKIRFLKCVREKSKLIKAILNRK